MDIANQDDFQALSTILSQEVDLNELNQDQLKKIMQLVNIDDLKNQFVNKKQIAKFDHIKVFESFLKHTGRDINNKSQHTAEIYTRYLKEFFNYIDDRSMHILEVDRKNANEYVNHLTAQTTAPATKRIKINIIKAYYNYLQHELDLINKNPFTRIKTPKHAPASDTHILTETEIKNLKNYYKTAKHHNAIEPSRAMLIIIDLLIDTGLRVGAVETLKHAGGNTYKYFSKGKAGAVKVNDKLSKQLETIDLTAWNRARIQRQLDQASKMLKVSRSIYTPHNFRHYFAVKEYRKNKDVYKLKELLNHSSIVITENYLKTLKLI